MKVNLPVTDHEIVLNDTDFMVSKTDLKGRITQVNRYFLEVSGFSSQDLVGKSHNIVRHPDMPAEAFEDLWTTIKSGPPPGLAWLKTVVKMVIFIGCLQM